METNEVKVEKEDGKVKKLEKQVNGLCAVLRKLKGECEKHWGIDIDGDGQIGSIRLNALLLLLCVGVVAAVMAGDLVNYPTPSGGVGFSVSDAGNATVGGTLTVNGTTALSGDVTLTGAISAAGITSTSSLKTGTDSTATTVTNAQVVTLSGGTYLVRGAGSANAATNTITLTRPTSGGEIVFLSNSSAATNLVAIADTGAFNGTAIELSAGESAILVGIVNADGTGTNAWAGAEL